jgi:hypothetical protein
MQKSVGGSHSSIISFPYQKAEPVAAAIHWTLWPHFFNVLKVNFCTKMISAATICVICNRCKILFSYTALKAVIQEVKHYNRGWHLVERNN